MKSSLIKLAENPLKKSVDESPDDDSMDYEEDSSMDEVNKGRSVNGPRTKLSNSEQEIRASISELAKSVRALAKSQSAIIQKFGGGGFPMPEEEPEMPMMPQGDEMGMEEEDEFGGMPGEEDDLDLGAENMFGGEFNPYGGEQAAAMRGQDVTMQRVPMEMARKAIVRKDDSSSNFGEKDSDIPGNRKLDPDNKDKSATDYLIQGDSGDGPGVNKALVDAVAKAVVSQLAKSAKIAKSANSPDVSNSQISKGEETYDPDALVQSATSLSFKDLNRKRVEIGLLSGGIL